MIGLTLSRYLSVNFARTILSVFGTMFLLIFLIDFVELLRRASDAPDATVATVAWLSLMRVPSIAEQIFPFSILFGAMFAFLNLTRKLELVVARAAGVSVWQFLAPPIVVALVLGIFATTLYNPMSAILKQRAARIETRMFGRTGNESTDTAFWIQEDGVDGQSVLRADRASDGGTVLSGVTAFVYDSDGTFMERVEATRGELRPGFWMLEDARSSAPGEAPRETPLELIATNLSAEQVQQKFVAPDAVPFWTLPSVRDQTALAGLNATGYSLQYQSLLARPPAVRRDGAGGGLLFLKIFPLWWRRPDDRRWSVRGLRALCSDKVGGRFGRCGTSECAGRGMDPGRGGKHAGFARLVVSGGWLMGRRIGPAVTGTCVIGPWRVLLVVALGVIAALSAAPSWLVAPAFAQADDAGKPKDRLLVDAKQLVYNRDTNVVTAEGNVQLYYQGRTLEADKVIYDRNSNRVFAKGHAKLTETDGSVTYSDTFDLTDDFKNGFIDSLSTVTKDKTFLTAPRAERSEGETTTFEKGTYTACAPCLAHPERPPLWQIKALKIIHKADEQMIYFEDAVFELYGLPIAYLPYFSTADPTVVRKTGFLVPRYVTQTRLGEGVSTPFFWNLAPNYDVTLTPTLLSTQGVLGQAEFRHRLDTGTYSITGSGIYQLDPSVFPPKPSGTGQRDLRGSIETKGLFFINTNWKYGWDIAVFSDKYYLQDYAIRSDSLTADYIKESISTAYLTGQGDRSFFDLRGYRVQGLSQFDDNKQQPLVTPVVNYNRTIEIAPGSSYGIGGEVNVDFNLTSLHRDLADYQSTGTRLLDSAFSLYDVCPTSATPNPALPNFKPPSCFLRGIGGDYTRASAQASWQHKYVDPIGEVWTPFVFARFDGSWLALNSSDESTFVNGTKSSTISNGDQANFFGSSNEEINGRVTPGVGLEWRYPFIASTSWASHVIEPIAQIIARPNVSQSGTTPNEDAQSLVFDDTNLFQWNKFSGYDRVEGGVRANAGVQYTMNLNSGGYLNTLFGQSYQLAGDNPYSIYDISNVGQSSGLETSSSDYVARVALTPTSNFSLITKARFSSADFTTEALDVIGTYKFHGLSGTVQYANYAAAPLIGFPYRREGVTFSSRYDFFDHYFVNGSATVQINPYKYDLATAQYDVPLGHPALAVLGAGVGYQDDCNLLTLSYSRSYTTATTTQSVNQTVMLSLTMRTLADFKLNQSLGSTSTVQDGVFK